MPGEWDIAGNFLQGVMARRQHEQQKAMNEELIKKAKAENTLIELQAKAAQRKADLFEKYTGGGVATAPQAQPPGIVDTLAQGQTQGALPGGVDPEIQQQLPDIIKQMQQDEFFSALGIQNPNIPKEYVKSIVNPDTGGPQTLAIGPTGRVIKAYPEFRSPKDYLRTTEEGGKEILQLQPGTTLEGGGLKGIIPISSATAKENQKDLRWTDETGTKWEMTVNATTGQPIPNVSIPRRVGQETVSAGKESGKSMYSANLSAAAQKAGNLAKNLFTVDDKGNLALTVSGRVQGMFPKISQALGGEIINDATQLTYALLRPESGAAINEGELQVKLGTILPKLMTDPEYAKDNFLNMGTVIDDYLSSIDPGYQPQARKIMERSLPGARKPSLSIGKKGKDYDMEYIPGQGLK